MPEFYREVRDKRTLVYYGILDAGLPSTREHEAEAVDVRFELLHPTTRKLLDLDLSNEEIEDIEEDCLINWRCGNG